MQDIIKMQKSNVAFCTNCLTLVSISNETIHSINFRSDAITKTMDCCKKPKYWWVIPNFKSYNPLEVKK